MWVRGLKLNNNPYNLAKMRSHPMWVRGLKLYHWQQYELQERVAPYVGAWIETQCRKY